MINKRKKEILRFLFVGGLTFIVDYGILYFFTERCGIDYFWSAAGSFMVAVFANYILCIRWVFKQSKQYKASVAAAFFLSSFAGLGINQICMWILVELFFVHYLLAKIIATIVVTIWNYVLKKRAICN